MKIKHSVTIMTAIFALPVLAQQQAPGGGQPSTWGSLFVNTILPIFIIVGVFIFFIRSFQRPILRRTQDHMAKQVQHMERVEQSLDRIIKLLEKKN
jgi:Kef-type K+ transport system membrane component KefB